MTDARAVVHRLGLTHAERHLHAVLHEDAWEEADHLCALEGRRCGHDGNRKVVPARKRADTQLGRGQNTRARGGGVWWGTHTIRALLLTEKTPSRPATLTLIGEHHFPPGVRMTMSLSSMVSGVSESAASARPNTATTASTRRQADPTRTHTHSRGHGNGPVTARVAAAASTLLRTRVNRRRRTECNMDGDALGVRPREANNGKSTS